MKYLRFFYLSLFAGLVAGCTDEPPAPGTAITNVTVIDAIAGQRNNQTVVFDGDQISHVGPASAQAYANTIDGTGKFLIPGLWDFHVHLTYEPELTGHMSALFLSYGITSVRDTGGLLHQILPVVERMREAGATAPRVYFAGPLLDGTDVVYDGNDRPHIGSSNASPEQASAMIGELKAEGVDFIKIYELVSADVFYAMVRSAEALDLPIDSHVPLALRARVAGPLVDSIEHLRNIELDCASNSEALHAERLALLQNPDNLSGFELRSSLHSLQRLNAITNFDADACDAVMQTLANTLQVPTLRLNALNLTPPYKRDGWQDALDRLPPEVRERWQQSADQMAGAQQTDLRFAQWSVFLTGEMHKRGIPIGAGTDTPIGLAVPGFSLHSELQMLVAAGLTPIQAIGAATVQPARWFSTSDQAGVVSEGMNADLVLLHANPLDDIANTLKIAGVVTKGRYLSEAELHDLRFPAQ
ncbi:MAG: amidohydrolase family protein [Proteobacteria bacterium]|nr:amidohydrolase family protein [Pseudomonadota bacterium]